MKKTIICALVSSFALIGCASLNEEQIAETVRDTATGSSSEEVVREAANRVTSELSGRAAAAIDNVIPNSTTEISVQIQKLFSYPVFLIFMTILSATIMLYIQNNTTNRIMLSIGLLISVLIYYINNFFYVFGNTEKIPVILSVWVPIFIFGLFNSILIYRINEK